MERMLDLVAVWDVALSDGVHKIEFEHGTTTGKRVVYVDGKVGNGLLCKTCLQRSLSLLFSLIHKWGALFRLWFSLWFWPTAFCCTKQTDNN
jgi:hypothetical protein